MIIGIGTGICEEPRLAELIQRRGPTFLDRVFSASEQALATRNGSSHRFYAGRFAAKDACIRALGTGSAERLSRIDVSILARPSGQPHCELAGAAARRARYLMGTGSDPELHVSISHEGNFAHAIAILEARVR